MIRSLCSSMPSRRRRRAAGLLGLPLAAAVLAAACSSGGSSAQVLDGKAGRGQQVARERKCTLCHTSDGATSEGPTWKGLAGGQVQLADGTTVTADDTYLTRSIREPRAQVVRGFKPLMPQTTGVSDEDVAALVAYINALR